MVGVLAYFGIHFLQIQSTKEALVIITVNGKEEGKYKLTENRTIYFPSKKSATNVIQIEDGKVKMIEADCPDQICVKHHPIQYNGETIVCLPHHLVVEIKSDRTSKVDGGTN